MIEIEKKYLVANEGWKHNIVSSSKIAQFYLTDLSVSPTIRVRQKKDKGYLTLKYPSIKTGVLERPEFEYEIPLEDIQAQRAFAKGSIVEKTRHLVKAEDGLIWEVDVFLSPNPNLVLAEIELKSADQPYSLPTWVGEDVTDDPGYSNIRMAFEGYATP